MKIATHSSGSCIHVSHLLSNMAMSSGPHGSILLLMEYQSTLVFNITFFLYSQLAVVIIGFIANLATFITLKQNKAIFSFIIRMLLLNQSCVDSLACLFALILILQVYIDP